MNENTKNTLKSISKIVLTIMAYRTYDVAKVISAVLCLMAAHQQITSGKATFFLTVVLYLFTYPMISVIIYLILLIPKYISKFILMFMKGGNEAGFDGFNGYSDYGYGNSDGYYDYDGYYRRDYGNQNYSNHQYQNNYNQNARNSHQNSNSSDDSVTTEHMRNSSGSIISIIIRKIMQIPETVTKTPIEATRITTASHQEAPLM